VIAPIPVPSWTLTVRTGVPPSASRTSSATHDGLDVAAGGDGEEPREPPRVEVAVHRRREEGEVDVRREDLGAAGVAAARDDTAARQDGAHRPVGDGRDEVAGRRAGGGAAHAPGERRAPRAGARVDDDAAAVNGHDPRRDEVRIAEGVEVILQVRAPAETRERVVGHCAKLLRFRDERDDRGTVRRSGGVRCWARRQGARRSRRRARPGGSAAREGRMREEGDAHRRSGAEP
jgi:hypothetical protein